MKEVAGATALILDASGTFAQNSQYLDLQCTSTLDTVHGELHAMFMCGASRPEASTAVTGSIHSLYREGTLVTGSYW